MTSTTSRLTGIVPVTDGGTRPSRRNGTVSNSCPRSSEQQFPKVDEPREGRGSRRPEKASADTYNRVPALVPEANEKPPLQPHDILGDAMGHNGRERGQPSGKDGGSVGNGANEHQERRGEPRPGCGASVEAGEGFVTDSGAPPNTPMTPEQWELCVDTLPAELRPLAKRAGSLKEFLKLLPIVLSEVQHARQAEAVDRILAAATPELRARHTRATEVINAIALYRDMLLASPPTGPNGEPLPPELANRHFEYLEENWRRINAAWEAIFGHGGDQAKRILLMQAVDVAARLPGDAAMVLAQLEPVDPELAERLAPHTHRIDELLVAWTNKYARLSKHGERDKWTSIAELWSAATGETTETEAWRRAWLRRTKPMRERGPAQEIAAPELLRHRIWNIPCHLLGDARARNVTVMDNTIRLVSLRTAVSNYEGVTVRSARAWIAQGRLPAVRAGRQYLVHPRDLARLLRPTVCTPTSELTRESLRAREACHEAGTTFGSATEATVHLGLPPPQSEVGKQGR